MKTVVAAALGECVHVAGVSRFLQLAEEAGWRTVFLGPATPIEAVVAAARAWRRFGGRVVPANAGDGRTAAGRFAGAADDLQHAGVRFAFGGTPPLADRAAQLGFFTRVFGGGEADEEVLAFLKGQDDGESTEQAFPQNMVERIAWKAPFPLIRHHYGQPTMAETLAGIEQIAEARPGRDLVGHRPGCAGELISSSARTGAAREPAACPCAAPTTTAPSMRPASGNWPLLRTYSGTDDFIPLAKMYVETINIAWCAIPLFWFNRMDV